MGNPTIKDRLNIVLVANAIRESETMMGGYRIAIECAKRFREQGHRVTFLTNRHGKAMISRYIPSAEGDFVLVPLPPGTGTRSDESFIKSLYFYSYMAVTGTMVARRLPLESRTVVYSTTPFWPDIFPGFFLRRRSSDTRWLTAMSMFAPPFWKGWKPYAAGLVSLPERYAITMNLNQLPVYALVRRRCDGIFVNNELDFDRAVRDGFDPERVGIIGMGVDNSLADLVPDSDNKEYDAVFIGRLHPQKGVLELIDIWHLFADKNAGARLAIIGNGPLEDRMRSKVAADGLEGKVDMLGFQDGLDKIRVFKASRIAIHSSLYDSGGMAALEAMSCGLPAVSFDLPDLAVYYPQGMLKTPCYDLGAFADNIEILLKDEDLYGRLSKEATDWAHQWDWDVVAQKLLELMEKLFASRPPNRP